MMTLFDVDTPVDDPVDDRGVCVDAGDWAGFAEVPPGTQVAVICSDVAGYVRAAALAESSGGSVRDSIRWIGPFGVRFVLLARNALVLGSGNEPRVVETVRRHGTGLLSLGSARVPGATSMSPTRWPPNMLLSHDDRCVRTQPRFRDSVRAVAGCDPSCVVRQLVISDSDRKVAALCPQFRADSEVFAWLETLLRSPMPDPTAA